MLYKPARAIIKVAAHIIYRFEVTGRHNIPTEGAFIFCANHIHSFDPAMVAIFTPRQPAFMAKKELFRNLFLNWLMTNLGAFPVDRKSADMKSYKKAMEILNSGEGILIFSQGTRMKEFENSKSGVAVFALKSGAKIVPIGIRGSYRPFTKIHINIGTPILMDKYKGQKVKTELVDEVMEKVVDSITRLCVG